MAMGHISVLRERGAPPKNQIECKNRINSSCKLESYVCPVGSLSKLSLVLFLFSLSFHTFSFLHTLYLKSVWSFSLSLPPFSSFSSPGLQARSHDSTSRKGRSPPIFSFILLVCQHESYVVSRAYEESALYRQVKRSPPTSWSENNFIGGYWLPPWSTVHAWTLDVNKVVGINKAIFQRSDFISTLRLPVSCSSIFLCISPQIINI